jgi:putative MATE family efflux protein
LWLDPADRRLYQRIWALTWPLLASNALDLAVTLIDLWLVRPFGPPATAALGVSRQVTFVIEAVAVAVTSGAITLVSQGVGARDRAAPVGGSFDPDAVVRQCVALVLLLGVPTAVAGYWLSGPLLVWLQTRDATRAHGEPYLRVYFAGLLCTWGYLVGAALFRGAGDVRTPLKLGVAVSLLQVALDYVLIYGAGPLPAFAVPGAALGAVVARACGTGAFLVLLARGAGPLRLRWPSFPGVDWMLIASLLRVGVPMALANVLRHGSRVVFLAIVGASALGVSFQAAVGVALQVRQVGILVALAFQTATATLVGQAIGRGDVPEAEALGRRSVRLLAVLMAAGAGMVVVLADPLAGLFLAAPEAAGLGAGVLRWFAVAGFFSALSIATQGALMGAGDTLPAMRYTLVSEWCLMLPLSYLLAVRGWVPEGLLVVWVLAPALTWVLMRRRFESGRWKNPGRRPGGLFSLRRLLRRPTIALRLTPRRMVGGPTSMGSALVSHAPPDPLDRHQRRREQSIPTVSVLCGPVGLASRRWRAWAAQRGATVVAPSGNGLADVVPAWVRALAFTRDLRADAVAWLARVAGQNPEEVQRHTVAMTGRDFEWWWQNLSIPADKAGAGAVCRQILAAGADAAGPSPGADQLLTAMTKGCMPATVRAVAILAELVPGSALPALLLTPPTTAAPAWLAEVAPLLVELVAAVPALPAAVAVDPSVAEPLLRAGTLPHALAVLREGVVGVESLGEAELTDRLRDAGVAQGASATVRRLARDGASEELAAAFTEAARRAGRKGTPEDEDAARSTAEQFLFERLETLAATAGLFALNQRLDFHHGPAPAEVDLVAQSLRVVVELDGSYYHLRDPVAYRRDRRKDWELQRRNYLVLRFLAEDVVERLEEILDTILAAVELRRSSQPERGQPS